MKEACDLEAIEEEDRYHQIQVARGELRDERDYGLFIARDHTKGVVAMGELPDQMIYGLFIARDNVKEMGRGYLTALRTQREKPRSSNSLRAEIGLLRATWNSMGPAVADVHSPGSFRPPTYGKMYYERSTVVKSKTYRKKKLPQQGASSPSRCPEGSVGGDIVEVPGRFRSHTSHVV